MSNQRVKESRREKDGGGAGVERSKVGPSNSKVIVGRNENRKNSRQILQFSGKAPTPSGKGWDIISREFSPSFYALDNKLKARNPHLPTNLPVENIK